jgi:glycosidase
VQWSSEKNAGFTDGTPWFYVNENYKEINVANQESDPDSVLNFYRKAISIRKTLPVVKNGKYKEHFKGSRRVFTYTREDEAQKLLVVCSFTDKKVKMRAPRDFDISKATLLLNNYEEIGNTLMPYEVRVYLLIK